MSFNEEKEEQIDLMAIARAHGMPTFDQFYRDPSILLGRDDEILASADAGSRNLDRHVQRHMYEIEGYRCKTLEEVERVALSQGINIRELDYRPQVMPTGAGKCDILVRFVSKEQREKRKLWG